jgi:hypothetical protein
MEITKTAPRASRNQEVAMWKSSDPPEDDFRQERASRDWRGDGCDVERAARDQLMLALIRDALSDPTTTSRAPFIEERDVREMKDLMGGWRRRREGRASC